MEQHIKEEISRQLDYYVDAYRKVHDIDMKIAALSDEISMLRSERSEAEKLRDESSELVNGLVENVSDGDEEAVKRLVEERLSPIIGLMVV